MALVRHSLMAFGLMFLSVVSVSADGLFQKVLAREGTLYFEDGAEVNLWGVNFQTLEDAGSIAGKARVGYSLPKPKTPYVLKRSRANT